MRTRSIESDIIRASGFGVLLAVGLAATVILYWSLMTSAQVLAVTSGLPAEETAEVGIWATAAMLFLGTAPMLRFLVAELPDRLAQSLRLTRASLRWHALFALGLVILFAV